MPLRGIVLISAQADIPARRREESLTIAQLLGDCVWDGYNFLPGVTPLPDGARPTTEQVRFLYSSIAAIVVARDEPKLMRSLCWIRSRTSIWVSRGIRRWRSLVSATAPCLTSPRPGIQLARTQSSKSASGMLLRGELGSGQAIPLFVNQRSHSNKAHTYHPRRLAPGLDPGAALDAVERELTHDPPYGAKVTFTNGQKALSFCAPIPQPWLDNALNHAAKVRMQSVHGRLVSQLISWTSEHPCCHNAPRHSMAQSPWRMGEAGASRSLRSLPPSFLDVTSW